MMEDESDANKTKTVCDDSVDDESGDKWFVPNDKVAEYAKSDEGGTGEARGQEDMQSSDKWSRWPSEEGCDIGSTESVAEYAKSDEEDTDEASGRDDMQSSSDKWSPPSVDDYAINIELDDVDNTRTVLFDILTRLGPQKMEEYIKQHLNRWKTEKVRIAVAGRSATGKSTFINKVRGIKEGQDGFADVGFGDETEKISEYRHPLNENIIFCDLPGLSMKFTKRKFLEMVNLSEYHYILIFFESVLTEDDEWLTVQIQENGIPFCLVRSKIDQDVESYKGKQIGEKGVLLKIRQIFFDSMAENTTLPKPELFIISSEKPHIGEMSNLQDHMKTMLTSSQFSAVVLSLSILTEAVVEKKILELKNRIPYLSIGIAILTSLSSVLSVPLDIALCVPEVRHYVTVFGLDQKYDENIEGLKNNFSKVSVDDIITRKYRIALDHQPHRSRLCDVPIIGSVYVCYETKKFVNEFLSDILSELKQDALTVYKHFLNKGSR